VLQWLSRVRHKQEKEQAVIEWTEVDPQHFETYPAPKPLKGPDEMDAVIALVAAGKTVEMTLADESVLRGRRMALGRRSSLCPV